MFKTLIALFVIIAVAFAAPTPDPHAVPNVYVAGSPYASPYSAYSAYGGGLVRSVSPYAAYSSPYVPTISAYSAPVYSSPYLSGAVAYY